jgi:hypothetical protein
MKFKKPFGRIFRAIRQCDGKRVAVDNSRMLISGIAMQPSRFGFP